MRRAPARPTSIRGLLHPAYGPLVRGEVRGPSGAPQPGLLVIDTGASMSAVDREVALRLQLPTHGAAEWHAVTDGDHPHVAPLRRGALRLAEDLRLWEVDLIEVANLRHRIEGYLVIALLGWDFLDQCKLVVDGPARTFSLELPR